MNSQVSQSHDLDAAPGWSMVLRLAREHAPGLKAVLGELGQRYEYPVYAYLRRSGRTAADALAATDAILERMLDAGTGGEPFASGQFRQVLLAGVRDFVGTNAGAGDAAAAAALPRLESDYQHDRLASGSPAQAFQRAFALVVLRRALQRLRDEAMQAGRQAMYDALEIYLAREPGPEQYASMSAALRTRQRTLVLALRRLRQRFRELAAEELADTVVDPDDLPGERAALLSCLGKLLP